MDLQLSGKRALVTGSSGGIGEVIARALAEEGASVAVHGRDPQRVERIVSDLSDAGHTATGVLGDLTDTKTADAVAAAAVTALGGIDILINNAGIYSNSSWDVTPAEEWLKTFNANTVSAVRLIRALVGDMRSRGWGRIIQIATGEATHPFATMPDYAASKAAMVNLTVSLAKSMDGSGVTANTISPGIIVTEGVEAFFRKVAPERGWGETWDDIEAGVIRDWLPNPTGRLGQPADVAYLAAVLASPKAGYVNGANYRIDGGSTPVIN